MVLFVYSDKKMVNKTTCTSKSWYCFVTVLCVILLFSDSQLFNNCARLCHQWNRLCMNFISVLKNFEANFDFQWLMDMFTLGVCASAQTGAVLLGIQKYVILCTHFENGALFCSIRANLKM